MVIDDAVMDTLVLGIVWVALILGALIVAEIAAKIFKWGDYDN
jgi:hypothetical protein